MRGLDPRKRKSIREEQLNDLSQKMMRYEGQGTESHSPMRVSRQNIQMGDTDREERQKTADIKIKDDYQVRLGRIEKLQGNVTQLENTNKQLFEKYSKNEKKLVLGKFHPSKISSAQKSKGRKSDIVKKPQKIIG
jgi:hypothetical protein